MKRRKNSKKALSTALLFVALSGFAALPVQAANTVITDGNWTATSTVAATTQKTITVSDVMDTSSALKVTAYQVAKGVYKDGKLVSYTLCDSTNEPIADLTAPTAAEVTAIADNISSDSTTLTGIRMTKSGTSYTADVEAGLYIVIVEDSDTYVYNPAVVAVNITDANQIASSATGGTVDMTSYFNFPTQAYLKSSTSGFDKSITGSTHNGVNAESKKTDGDTIAFGDTVSFKLDRMTIPSYSDDYAEGSLKYEINDNLDPKAFSGLTGLAVKVGGDTVAADSTTYSVVFKDKDGLTVTDAAQAVSFSLSFKDSYIRSNASKTVEITYSSVVQNTAGLNYSENKNTATLTYSNNPSDSTSYKTLTDHTYHYTFGIDADLDGEDGGKTTYELNKVTKSGEEFEETSDNRSKKSKYPLEGAVFTLYSDAAMTQAVGTATSDSNGHISFTGLDEGVYYLKETTAPSGYTLNDTDYQITIAATLNDEGIMTSYTMDIKSKDSETGAYSVTAGSASYTNTPVVAADGSVENTVVDTTVPAEIVNTNLASLPSTGGAGTFLFISIGAVGMTLFLGVIIAVNKKKKEDTDSEE